MLRNIPRGKEGHFIMIEGQIYWENIKIINVHTAHTRALKYMKQKLNSLKGERDNEATASEEVLIPHS